MPQCRRVYGGVRCKGFLADDGAGGLEDCTLCSRPPPSSTNERHIFYQKNALEIIADIRTLGRVETRVKWRLTKEGLRQQEVAWVKQGLITKRDRMKWTKTSHVLYNTIGQRLPDKKPGLSSSDRGRKITATEKLYKDDEIRLPLGDLSMGDMKLEVNLKVGRQSLVKMIRKALNE